MVNITLYGTNVGPPFRACLLTLKALNLPFKIKCVDIFDGDNLSEEYLKKNPQHTVPTLEDDGHFIWDSHAIMAYLVSKYGKDDSLYPKDLLKRAVVDQRLHFETGVVFQDGLKNITAPMFFKNQTQILQHKIDAILNVYSFLETFLSDMPYMAGDQLTIADFSIISTVSTLVVFAEIDSRKYPRLSAWVRRLETTLPYYKEANAVGAQKFIEMIKAKNFSIVP